MPGIVPQNDLQQERRDARRNRRWARARNMKKRIILFAAASFLRLAWERSHIKPIFLNHLTNQLKIKFNKYSCKYDEAYIMFIVG